MTQVNLKSYSEQGDGQGRPVVVTTDSKVEGLSKKAAFHLMKNLTLDIEKVISAGEFTEQELGFIGRLGDSFQ